MKRPRESYDNNDAGTTTGEQAAALKQNAALEEIRAKLEQARLKKLAAEERLLRQRQQTAKRMQRKELEPPISNQTTTSSSAAATASATTITGASQSKDAGVARKTSINSRAQEAQMALVRARSKLKGAMENRERALMQHRKSYTNSPIESGAAGVANGNKINRKRWSNQRFSLQQQGRFGSNSSLPPISALSLSLKITDISRTGPPNTVYHDKDRIDSFSTYAGHLGSRSGLEKALGGKEAIEALRRGSDSYCSGGENIRNTDDASAKKDIATTTKPAHNENHIKKSTTLLQRKIQLQNELMALKEKLEMKASREQKQNQQEEGTPTKNRAKVPNDDSSNKKPTREGLERRKAEVQTIMDISYWKHFVSKQEHLLEQVTTKINNIDNGNHSHQEKSQRAGTYKECLQRRHSTNKAIAKVQQDLDIIDKRQEVVEEGIFSSTQKLLEARQLLHEERRKNEHGH